MIVCEYRILIFLVLVLAWFLIWKVFVQQGADQLCPPIDLQTSREWIDLTACYGHCCDASLPRGTEGGSMPDLRPYECDADD